jgi:carbon-monoxide dehydrogenase large subunit
MTVQGIGAAVQRREDFRFIKGAGKYTDDINIAHQLYCYILRSPVAHAAIRKIDISGAKSAPGVVAVFTGADIDASGVGGLPCGWLVTGRDGNPMKEPKHPILASGKVRHVGDPVVAVIAQSLQQARDAAERVTLDLEELPAVVNMKAALSGGAAVHEEAPDNLCFEWELGDKAATDAAFWNAAVRLPWSDKCRDVRQV